MLPAHLHVRLVHVLDQGSLVQVSQRIPWWSLSRSAAALGGLRGRRPRAQGCRRKPLAGLAASALRVAGSSSRAAPPAPVSHHRSPLAPEAGEGAGSREPARLRPGGRTSAPPGSAGACRRSPGAAPRPGADPAGPADREVGAGRARADCPGVGTGSARLGLEWVHRLRPLAGLAAEVVEDPRFSVLNSTHHDRQLVQTNTRAYLCRLYLLFCHC